MIDRIKPEINGIFDFNFIVRVVILGNIIGYMQRTKWLDVRPMGFQQYCWASQVRLQKEIKNFDNLNRNLFRSSKGQ